MKKLLLISLLILLSTGVYALNASDSMQTKTCRDDVVEFYKVLYTSNDYGINGIRVIENKSELCDHLSLEKINEIVRKAPVSFAENESC